MSRFNFCDCPAGFSAAPERHAPDCPGRSGAGKAPTPVPATYKTPAAPSTEAVPRPGMEFWDKLNALPRYAFFLSPSGSSVQKFEDKALGNWIDVHEAQKIVDQAQERISELRAELGAAKGEYDRAVNRVDALQQRLNAADQRIGDLTRYHEIPGTSGQRLNQLANEGE